LSYASPRNPPAPGRVNQPKTKQTGISEPNSSE
jgi:hypothetical protein